MAPQNPPPQRAPEFLRMKQCTQDRIRYEISTIINSVKQMGEEFCGAGWLGNWVDGNLKCHTVAARIASYLISSLSFRSS